MYEFFLVFSVNNYGVLILLVKTKDRARSHTYIEILIRAVSLCYREEVYGMLR